MSAIEQIFKNISKRELARQLGISHQAVGCWVVDNAIPPRRVLDVERITGIHRHRLAPNLYPDKPPPKAPKKRT